MRTGLLRCTKAVSELLSQHVLQNYDKFVAGIDEVGKVEEDLIAAYQTVKVILCFSQISATSPLSVSRFRHLLWLTVASHSFQCPSVPHGR